ncbi:hypothetical protein [Burkholderia cenocepacia]
MPSISNAAVAGGASGVRAAGSASAGNAWRAAAATAGSICRNWPSA